MYTQSLQGDQSYFSRNVLDDPYAYHSGWTFQDPLVANSGMDFGDSEGVYIHRNHPANKVYILLKTNFYDLETAKLNRHELIKKAIRGIFNAYDKACKFFSPELYREDSRVVNLIKQMANREGQPLVLQGGTDEEPVTYDFSSLGLTDENMTDPKKIVDAALEAGILNLYTISDYLESTGYSQFLEDEEFLVPDRDVVHLFLVLDGSYIEAIPTNVAVGNSWMNEDVRNDTQFINLANNPEEYDSAAAQWVGETAVSQFLKSDSGQFVACMYSLEFEDMTPEQKEACEREVEEAVDRIDRLGIGAMFEGDVDELRERYPNASRAVDHLAETYGTLAKALTDHNVAGDVAKRIGRKMLKAEAAGLHKQMMAAAFRRNVLEDYAGASKIAKSRNVSESFGKNAAISFEMDKFDTQVSTVSERFSDFHRELADFYSGGGYIRTQDLQYKKYTGSKKLLQDTPDPVTGVINPLASKVNNNLIESPSGVDGLQNYTFDVSWNSESSNLKEVANRIKMFVIQNVSEIKKFYDSPADMGGVLPPLEANVKNTLDSANTMFLPSVFGLGDPNASLVMEFSMPLSEQCPPIVHICPSYSNIKLSTRKMLYPNPASLTASDLDKLLAQTLSLGGERITDSPQSPVYLQVSVPDGFRYINLGLPGQHASGQSVGTLIKYLAGKRHTAGFIRHLNDIYEKINNFSPCNSPVPGSAVGLGGLFEGAKTPAGFALEIAGSYLYPPADPKGFGKGEEGARGAFVKANVLSPGQSSLLPAAKGVIRDVEATYKAFSHDIDKAIKEQIDVLKTVLPKGDKRCFDWEYIKSVIFRNWNWRNLVCKLFECLGVPVPVPFPKFTWPGWPDLWPPKFPWPPTLPLADIWELIKQAILAILCSIITMLLNMLNVDCNLYNMLTEELIKGLGLDDDFAKLKESIRQNPALEFLVELTSGPMDPITDQEMQLRIRGELNDRLDDEECDPGSQFSTIRQPLTNPESQESTGERYDPRPDISRLITDLQLVLTPSEFCEMLGGEAADNVINIVGATANKKYLKLHRAFNSDNSRLCDILGFVGQSTIGKAACMMLSKAPDMVTPPAQVCHSQSLREKLLSGRLSKEELSDMLEKEQEKRNQFIEKILTASQTGNVILNGLGISNPIDLVGGTPTTANDPNNPVKVPYFDDYSINFKKQIIEQNFKPIKKAYSSDVSSFLEFLVDTEDPAPMQEPQTPEQYAEMYPPGEVSEKEKAMIFKQMMDNPYSGLYKNYTQAKEDLGEDAVKAIRHLHFFIPSDPVNLEELDDDLKRKRMEAMFLSWHQNMAFGGTPGAKLPEREVAKRLKQLLRNSNLIETVKEGDNFFVQLRFPNLSARRDPANLESELTQVDTGGLIVYDSTPGDYCATDFEYVEDSYKISFNGSFFTSRKNTNKLESFEERPAKIRIKDGPVKNYFVEKMDIKNGEPTQPTAFAELLRLNTVNWPWLSREFQDRDLLESVFKTRDGLFYETALEAYNEMEQYIFESFGRFISESDVLNPLEDRARFPRGSRGIIDPIDVGRAGLEILAEDINPLFTDTDPPCPIPGLMDWDSVKDKVISQLGSLLDQQYGDEPSWPSPLQYSIATAGFLNSWVRLEIVQIILEGLVSFYEFGLDVLKEKVVVLFIRNRIKLRVEKQGRGFKRLFEALATKVLAAPAGNQDKPQPDSKVGLDRFKLKIPTSTDEEFDYKNLDAMIENNVTILKGKVSNIISAPENLYDGFYETFPSFDLFKNTKIIYDEFSDFPNPNQAEGDFANPIGSEGGYLVLADRVRYSRSREESGGYKPEQENQLFKPVADRGGNVEVLEEIAPYVGEGTFAFQKFIKFVPNKDQTETELYNLMTEEGSATAKSLSEEGVSFLEENPHFFPDSIPLGDFQNFVEGLGGPPPEEEGDMSWWVEHFASDVPETPAELFQEEDEVKYPENTYYSVFSADTTRKSLAESILLKMTVQPDASFIAEGGGSRVPGVPRNSSTPEGDGTGPTIVYSEGFYKTPEGQRVIKHTDGYWYFISGAPVGTSYYRLEVERGTAQPIYRSRFMNPKKWNGPTGRNELLIDNGMAFGDYIQDELIARTAEGNFPTDTTAEGFSSGIIDQTKPSGRMFLDYWQLPEGSSQINKYNLDYENLWIPARFEVIDYKYKELPRFVHGSTDLFKDKAGVLTTLSEIKSAIEAVSFLDGPWDALHQSWRRESSIHWGYGFNYHSGYTRKIMLDQYLPMLFTQFDKQGQFRPGNTDYTGGKPPGQGMIETQTWKDCIDRGLVMIANWPTMDGKSDEEFENLNISQTSWKGPQTYNSHINPYPASGHQGKWGTRTDGRAWEHDRVKSAIKYSLWWWDLACLIANEYDNQYVFTTMEPGARFPTSSLSEMLSFQDEYKEYLNRNYSSISGRRPETWREWADVRYNFHHETRGIKSVNDLRKEATDWGFRGRFHYASVFASGHRQGYTTGSKKDWDLPLRRRTGPDILPGIVQKRGDRGKSRAGEMACYMSTKMSRGRLGSEKIDRMVAAARLLLEARDKYHLGIDPSTLDERGKSLYGYYEKFLLQRLRLPDYNRELPSYGWPQQRNMRSINQPKVRKYRAFGEQEGIFRYPAPFDHPIDHLLMGSQSGAGLDEDNFGFSYEKYNLPSTSGDWVIFMKQVDELIEYVKAQPATTQDTQDTAVRINPEGGSVSTQYAVHFVNAKAVFSGALRSPKGQKSGDRDHITASETKLSRISVESDGAYDETGSFKVINALMDPNSDYWGDMPAKEKAKLIRDNVKIVAQGGPNGRNWWRGLMKMWGFKGECWWRTEYTTEMVGETREETINQDPMEESITEEAPEVRPIGDSTSNADRATLHPIGGTDSDRGFYLWSRGYKISALSDWRRLEETGKAWFYNLGSVRIDSPKAYFFTWGDDDIQLDKQSPRAISKFLMKNKLAERLIGVAFDQEAMWFGDDRAPSDTQTSNSDSFTTTIDRPENYWTHTKLNMLMDASDFGRVFKSGSNSTGITSYLTSVRNLVQANSIDGTAGNTLQQGRGGQTLDQTIREAQNNGLMDKLDIIYKTSYGLTTNKENLELNQLSVVDLWPDNSASDTNPYTWHRDYIFYNALKKKDQVKDIQKTYSGFNRFFFYGQTETRWEESGGLIGAIMGLPTMQEEIRSSSDVIFGAVQAPGPRGGDFLDIPYLQVFNKAPTRMVSHFLPHSEKENLYIPSPFGIHPNLALYVNKYEDDPVNSAKLARPDTPLAKRQAKYGSENYYPLGKETSVFTATKTLVRKRVSFVVKRSSTSSGVGGIGAWFYGGSTDSEGNITNLDLPPERLDVLEPALEYFDQRSLEGKAISVHKSIGEDSVAKNTKTLIDICKELESENYLGFTYLRMWQARKHYLQEYSRWAQEDVVEAFKRLQSKLAGCVLQYGSRLIYLPKMDENGLFSDWDAAVSAEGALSPDNIGNASSFQKFFDKDSRNFGLEVVSKNADEMAIAGDEITSNSKVIPIPYVPIVEKMAPMALSDLVRIEKATPEEIAALGFSEAFADLVSEQDGGLPLVKFLTKGTEFVDGAFVSSLLPTNEDEQKPALNVQDYLIREIKNSPESEILFKYLFPLERYASIYSLYCVSATSSLYNLDNLFFDTRERLISLLKMSIDTPYDVFPSEFEKIGIMPPDMAEFLLTTRMSGFRSDQWSQIIKMITNAPKGLAMMILSMTDPFYFDAQKKLKSCDLRKGMHPRSFAMPFRDNHKGHQLKPFTLYPPIPFMPPFMYGPMDIGIGGLYDPNLDSMASPLGPALLAAGPLFGDKPKSVCNYTDGDKPPTSVAFNPAVGKARFLNPDCDDEE